MNSSIAWSNAVDHPVAEPSEVHIWRALLDLNPIHLSRLWETLTPTERSRAGRFQFDEDRRRFVAGRGILRDILARYLGKREMVLELSYGPSGKPALPPAMGEEQLHFNLSHCRNLAVYAISQNSEVGIDVEFIEPSFASEAIAEQFFAPPEVSSLRTLPPRLWPEAFFNCWTRKEAYVKALGDGLRITLDSFEVSLTPGEPAALRGGADPGWSICCFEPAQDCVGAVVARGNEWNVRFWNWDSSLRESQTSSSIGD
jgi:4'-phosphopantetheinyl transferase